MGVDMVKQGADFKLYYFEIIIANDNFTTVVISVTEVCVVCDKPHKFIIFNKPINNSKGLSVLMVTFLGIKDTLSLPSRFYSTT